jgi:hypothetical protein
MGECEHLATRRGAYGIATDDRKPRGDRTIGKQAALFKDRPAHCVSNEDVDPTPLGHNRCHGCLDGLGVLEVVRHCDCLGFVVLK